MASRIGSAFQSSSQKGTVMASAIQKPWRTMSRTARTEWRFSPRFLAIIGETAEIMPMPKISMAK